MSTPATTTGWFEPPQFPKRQVLFGMAVLLAIAVGPFLIWPTLASRILATNFLPHLYCYLGTPGLVWTHVTADFLIGLAYLTISGTLVYLVWKGRRDIPFHWMFLAFGAFIVACGGTHFMEVVTVWIPVYVLSATLKVLTALVSVATAVLLPFTVPQVLSLIQTAKASEAAEGRFRALLEAAPDAIFVVSEERVVFVNPSGVRLLGGQQPEQVEGKKLSEIVHPASLASVRGRIRDSYQTGVAAPPLEHVLIALDGSSVEIESASIPISWKGLPAIEAIARDVRERKRAEAKLREYEKAVEGLEEMIVVVDREYCYVLANRAFLNYRGLEREQLIGRSSREMLNEGVFDTVIKGKLDECFQGKVVKYEMQYRYPRLGERDVSISYFPIEGPGGIDRVACVVQDITERKRAEEALSRLAAIVESSDDAIVSKNLDGTITSWNAGAQRIFGYAEAEAVGHSITIIIPPELRDEEAQILRRLRAGEHIQHYETVRVTKQGKRVDVSLTISPMEDSEGKIVGASKIARDITARKRVEEDLQRSEAEAKASAEELAVILDAVPGMALISRDPTGQSITGSRFAYELLRLPYGANISKSAPEGDGPSNFRIIKDGQELPPSELPLQKAAATGQGIRDSEITLVFDDGSSCEIFGNAAPFLDHQGKVRGAVGVFVDITQRNRAEKALRESEDRYRDLVENSQDLLCTHDLKGNLLSANAASARILGYEVSELLRIPMREFITPDFRGQFDEYLARITKHGADKGLMAVVTRTGERRIWEYNNTLRTEGVTLPIVRGLAHDITERVRAEKELRDSEQRFRQLAENIREVFYLTDANSLELFYVSPAYEQVWGRTCQSLYETPESFLTAIHRDDREMVRNAYLNRDIFMHEYRIVRPDGSVRWILDRGFPVRNAKGEVYRLAGIAEDITENKLAEQAAQESQAELARVSRIATMGELTASIAHEINQPLAAVVTNASASLHWLAAQPPNLAEAREAMTSAMQEANHASRVIERIRALLKKAPPELRPLDVNEMIREVLALTHNECIKSAVAVHTELAADVPGVIGDRVQLQQVMLNLIMNAIDAMTTIKNPLRIMAIKSARHAEGVLIQVQDSGKGLDPKHSTRIFDSFFTTKPEGIGMGLSISRSIVETHGGRLWATPAPSHGAVFQLILPKAA
jgi:PAS domain S-box-containing protein